MYVIVGERMKKDSKDSGSEKRREKGREID